LDSENVSAWVADVVRAIGACDRVEWAVVVVNEAKPVSRPSKLPYKFYRKVDRALLPGRPDVFAKVKVPLPSGVPTISIKPEKKGIRNFFSEESLQRIEAHKPDVLLRFGFGILSGQILTLPKFGVWSMHHGDYESFRGGPPGFWEWFYKVPTTGAMVQRLTEELDGGECIARTITKTNFASFSRNQAGIFSKGIDLMADAVKKLALSGTYTVAHRHPIVYSSVVYQDPGFRTSLRAFWKAFVRAIPVAITKIFFREQWVIFFALTPNAFPALNFRKFKALVPTPDRIWADPFVVSQNGKHYVFIEELMVKTNKGHLSCLVLDDKGRLETNAKIIERDYHFSYPFVFYHEGYWYMIPETAENKTVDLYECTSFPFQWKFKRTLLSGKEFFDATLFVRDGRHWLLCTSRGNSGASFNDDLCLFYTDRFPEGEWISHPKNPVLADPSSARPAGRIFSYQGNWYRPSQICSPRYGYGLSINRIVTLNESEYREENVSKALPIWREDLLCVHTLNFTQGITVIDGQLKRTKWRRAGMNSRRILFVMDSLSTGGAEYSTLNLAGWLRNEMKWDVKVAYLKSKRPAYNPIDFGLQDDIVSLERWSFPWRLLALYKFVFRWRPQMVHSVLLYSNFFCRAIRLFNRAPIFIESLVNRTYDESRFRDPKVSNRGLRMVRLADRISQKFGADYFHAVTNDIAIHFAEHTSTPASKLSVVYRGRQARPLPQGAEQYQHGQPIIFLTAGRHEYQKGTIHLLRAYKKFLREFSGPSTLLVAGREGAQTPALEKFITENNLKESVQLMGHRDQLMELMAACDVFVLPSLFEGIGGVLIEAESVGLPIICSNLDGLKEVVCENENALLVEVGDEERLKEAMLKMANDHDLRLRFGKRSKEIFLDRFEESKSHENMLRFYLDKIEEAGFEM
jgi:glycosyltransferase involved in cell wall biosynthesis/folate-dependent phosphoribosylglycinamide formyltransferase PurN